MRAINPRYWPAPKDADFYLLTALKRRVLSNNLAGRKASRLLHNILAQEAAAYLRAEECAS